MWIQNLADHSAAAASVATVAPIWSLAQELHFLPLFCRVAKKERERERTRLTGQLCTCGSLSPLLGASNRAAPGPASGVRKHISGTFPSTYLLFTSFLVATIFFPERRLSVLDCLLQTLESASFYTTFANKWLLSSRDFIPIIFSISKLLSPSAPQNWLLEY